MKNFPRYNKYKYRAGQDFYLNKDMAFEKHPKIINKYERQKRKTTPSLTYNLILFAIGLFLTILSLNIYQPALVPNDLRIISLNKNLNIVILGCDEIFPETEKGRLLWKGRSDTIIILHCNPFKNKLNILNIPRDTKIKVSGHGIEKINYLNTINGPKFTRKYLEKLLRIPIDHYVIVNVHGLNKIIDEIGGIIIDVPQRMLYEDKTAKLRINLYPGKQLLNGEQTVGFLRFRHDALGDIGRIQRQQAFMRAVFKKLSDPIIFTKVPEIVSIYKKTVLTDLKPVEIIKIANFVRSVPNSNQNIILLPGDFGHSRQVSYWIPNQKEINKIIKKLFYDKGNSNSLKKFKRVNPKNIKITVQNASIKDHHLANKLSAILREYGYTVLVAPDSEIHMKTTKIYAQKANPEVASQVKHDIGNKGDLLIGNLGDPSIDVTILAGDDLVNLKSRLKK